METKTKQTNNSLDEDSLDEFMRQYNRDSAKLVVGLLSIMASCLLGIWGINWYQTGETHPIRQWNKVEEHSKKGELIFGEYGFADRNRDGVIDFLEKVDAYRRMGFTDRFSHNQRIYPVYTLSQLDRAIESYQKPN
jgi:hypothetical protein